MPISYVDIPKFLDLADKIEGLSWKEVFEKYSVSEWTLRMARRSKRLVFRISQIDPETAKKIASGEIQISKRKLYSIDGLSEKELTEFVECLKKGAPDWELDLVYRQSRENKTRLENEAIQNKNAQSGGAVLRDMKNVLYDLQDALDNYIGPHLKMLEAPQEKIVFMKAWEEVADGVIRITNNYKEMIDKHGSH